jgi:hypothetical protein
MQLKEYIKNEIFLPRLKKNGILVIYDRHGICRNACLELETPKIKVIDAGESSILSREAALKTLYDFGKYNSKLEGMAVYVPAKPPVTEEDKQRDPFSVYGACGNIFPDGDGDDYINICLKFKPDRGAQSFQREQIAVVRNDRRHRKRRHGLADAARRVKSRFGG